MGALPLVTRPLERIEEFRSAEELQRRVWGFVDVEVVPLHTLLAASKNGGLALGAFRHDDAATEELVGLAFGFAGRDALGPKHHSHIVGVVPETQGRGVGAALKLSQREQARAQGFDRITWTYDPLMAGNARFNLGRLGAVASRYLVDVYGEIRDELNRGLPTDRLVVDWWLADAKASARAAGRPCARPEQVGRLPEVTRSRTVDGGDRRVPVDWRHIDARCVLVEIPVDLPTLKVQDPDAARAWRLLVREALIAHFAAGYQAVDAFHVTSRAFYLLERFDGAATGAVAPAR